MAERTLTEKQKTFLECLFLGGVDGDFVKAKNLAGYSETTPTSEVVKSLKEEILEATRLYLTRQGPRAAVKLVGVMEDPNQLGTKALLAASKDILDRVGLVKTEKIEVGTRGIFYLPPKEDESGE